ncbi:MAG: glycosyltransferase [Sphaerochaeta sp.]|jgi:glycosyltransferase involved in cell wall biosynthesis|nr:glycosyltransferase [Sphaerochaeta sp.]
MITWNEEKLLPTAIESARGLYDEIVVLDTGSDDTTAEVARKMGCNTITGGDRWNKGEARNDAIRAAAGDWVVILDADEVILDPTGLRNHLLSTKNDAVFIKIHAGTQSWNQMRAWKRGAAWYKYRAHEVPVFKKRADYTDFIFEHHQPADRWTWKLGYTLSRLLLDVEENPDDPRPVFYLGRQYGYMKRHDEAIKTLTKYLSMAPTGFDAPEACLAIHNSQVETGDITGAMRSLHTAIACQPRNRWPPYLIASKYHSMGEDALAAGMLKYALEITTEIGYQRARDVDIHDLLARCLWKLGRYEEGRSHAAKA